ncbi:lysophosphatidylcholine acyltransferase [Acrasis kona]|uniref:Lysophosphatidylcholine acyltransferase n=1 Tax=Acrasis kona TaxID=1008807 RepID=A0AAW2ZQQ3_9EUKA
MNENVYNVRAKSIAGSFGNVKNSPWLRNDVLTKPLERILLIIKLVGFSGFWLSLIVLRITLLTMVIIPGMILVKIILLEFKQKKMIHEYKDLEGWRRLFFDLSILITSRKLLFVLGVYDVERRYITQTELELLQEKIRKKDCAGPKHQIRTFENSIPPFLIISNRVSLLDPIILSSEFGAISLLCKRWIATAPIIGELSRKVSCIFTDDDIGGVMRLIGDRSRDYYSFIQNFHTDNLIPRFAVFPEGTTTNGSQLIEFHSGPFALKLPVQPVVIRYPFRYFNAAWLEVPSTLEYVLLLLSQVFQSVQIIHFPTYEPNEEEKEDPVMYANNVRTLMCEATNMKAYEPLVLSKARFENRNY